MTDSASILAFPANKIVRQPQAARPAPRQYSLSPESKWQLFRAVRGDATLSHDSVLAMGHVLDFYQQSDGFSCPSIGSITKCCRFYQGKHKKHDMDRTFAALNSLIRGGWLHVEPYEIEPGSGFPGWKFYPVRKDR